MEHEYCDRGCTNGCLMSPTAREPGTIALEELCSLTYCNDPAAHTYTSEAGDFHYCQRHAQPFQTVERAQLPPLRPLTQPLMASNLPIREPGTVSLED